jgi:hypothetical protein
VGRPTGHINSAALRAFVDGMYQGTKSQLARDALITPAHLGDLCVFRNRGTNPDLRRRLADALGVPVEAITCRCPRPGGGCLSLGDLDV